MDKEGASSLSVVKPFWQTNPPKKRKWKLFRGRHLVWKVSAWTSDVWQNYKQLENSLMMGSGGQPLTGRVQLRRCRAGLLSWTHVKAGGKPSASHTHCLVQATSLTYEVLSEQPDFHMGFLKTEYYVFFFFFLFLRKCLKNSMLKFYPDSLLRFGTTQLENRKLRCLFSCLSPTHFSSPRAMTGIDYFFQHFKIRCKELCLILIRAEMIFLRRKANDLSELLLPSNTKTASLRRLQGLDLWEFESQHSLPYSALMLLIQR